MNNTQDLLKFKQDYINANMEMYEQVKSMNYDETTVPGLLKELSNDELCQVANRYIELSKKAQDNFSKEMLSRIAMFSILGIHEENKKNNKR